MLKIRLRRMGAIRQPHYRIVVADSRAPRDGAFIENLGSYNPLTNPATININVDRYEEWKQKGAQPTEAVISLVRQYNRAVRNGTQAIAPLTKKAERALVRRQTEQAAETAAAETAASETAASETAAAPAAQSAEASAGDEAAEAQATLAPAGGDEPISADEAGIIENSFPVADVASDPLAGDSTDVTGGGMSNTSHHG